MRRLATELRQATRLLWRSPKFSAAAVLTLFVGMGAAITVFSVASGALLGPLPYGDAERLVHIQGDESSRYALSMPLLEAIGSESAALADLGIWQGWGFTVRKTADQAVQRRYGASVSANYFHLLGTRPRVGRLFTARDGEPGHEPVVVLSYGTWRSDYGGDPGVVGSRVAIDGSDHTIAGVAPEGFEDPVGGHVLGGVSPTYWRASPPSFESARSQPGWVAFWAIGRLRPGASADQLEAEIARIAAERQTQAELAGESYHVRSFREVARAGLASSVAAIFAAAVLLLLIACANVANLLLARATDRAREIAVRRSIGGSDAAVVSHLMMESAVLAAAGTLGALLIARAALSPLRSLLADQLRPGTVLSLDMRVVAFAVIVALMTTFAFGLGPALFAVRSNLQPTLRGRGSGRHAGPFHRALVGLQVAIGVLVLVGAGLFGRTLLNLASQDVGFDHSAVWTARVFLMPEVFPDAGLQNQAVRDIESAVRRLPGVERVSLITDFPLSGAVNSTLIPAPSAPDDASAGVQTMVRAVTPSYFATVGVPVRSGRPLAPADVPGSTGVAVVNEAFADRMFPGESPLGRVVSVRGAPKEIVGVVANSVELSLLDGKGDPVLYTAYPQEDQARMRESVVLVVGGPDPGRLDRIVPAAIQEAQPSVAVSEGGVATRYLDRQMLVFRLRAMLLVLFGAAALAFVAFGAAWVTAHAVARRRKEIGIRVAIGATPPQVLRLLLRSAGRPAIIGMGAGVVFAFAAGTVVEALLFGVRPMDWGVYALSVLVLGAVVATSTWLPARRATRMDPAFGAAVGISQ